MKVTLLLLLAALVYLCSARSLHFPIHTVQHAEPRPDRYARNAEASSEEVAPLIGDFYSLVVNISIVNDATPGQYYRLLVDTGSQITAVTGPQVNYNVPKFLGSNTSTIVPCNAAQCLTSLPCNTGVGCNFSQGYLSGQSVSGYYYTGSVVLDGVTAKNVPFGVISAQSGSSFGALAAGVMGLGRVNSTTCSTSFSGICFPNIVQAFNNSGAISAPNFGLALDYQGNGQMVIGENDPSLYVGSLTYFPMYSDALYYTTANALAVGNTDLGVTFSDFGNTLFDSGTSYIYLPNAVFGKMAAAFQANYGNVTGVSGTNNLFVNSQNCFDDMRDQLPPLVFTIESTQVIVSPFAYILPQTINFKTQYCLGINSLTPGAIPTTILGSAFMRGKYLYHDIQNQRIGMSFIHANVSASSSSGVFTTITSTTGHSAAMQTEVNVMMMVMMVAVSVIMSLF